MTRKMQNSRQAERIEQASDAMGEGALFMVKLRRILLPELAVLGIVFWGYPYLYRVLVLEGGYLRVSETFGVVYGPLVLAVIFGLVLYNRLNLLKRGRKNYREQLAVLCAGVVWLGAWKMTKYAEASWSVPVHFEALGKAMQEPIPKNLVVSDARIDFDRTYSLRTNMQKAKGGTIYAAYYAAPLIAVEDDSSRGSVSGVQPWICVRYEETIHSRLPSSDAEVETFYRAADVSFASSGMDDVGFFEQLTERDNMFDEFAGLVERGRVDAQNKTILLYAVSEPFDDRAHKLFVHGVLLFFLALGVVVIPVLVRPLRLSGKGADQV